MANHLFIGLGGTGGKILRAMRQRVFEEFGTNDPESKTIVDYIYVDSDETDLNDDRSWNYMGSPVHLSPNQKVNIHGIGGGVLDNLDSYPGIRAFITPEDRELLRSDAVSGIIDTGIGGQRRRFGRILMANNVVNNPSESYKNALHDHIHHLTELGGTGKMTFHIIAGLAGGTGSGSIVDAVAQLHKIIAPMSGEYEVYLYLYVPEILVEARANEGFYHANGYAALTELNAISLGDKYQPTDISGDIDIATGKVKRLAGSSHTRPFKMAYLFSDRNENSNVLKKNTKLPSAIADFLFQRTFGQEDSTPMQKLVNLENNAGTPEKDENGNNIHDRHFMTMGIVRISYPESEIKQFAVESCENSICCALDYNFWVNNGGFRAEPEENASVGINIEVKTPAFLEYMHLSHEYITLQKPLADYPGSDNFTTFEEYWNNITTFFGEDTLASGAPRQSWVAEFDAVCDNDYNSNFRNIGVKRYFANLRQDKEVRNYASVICNHIEKILFNEWINGKHGENSSMSLQKVEIYIKELEQSTRDRIPTIGAIKTAIISERDEALAVANGDKTMLTNTGWLSNMLFDTAQRHFLNYVEQKKIVYVCNTNLEALDFAELLLAEIVSRLNAMGRYVALLRNMFKTGMEVSERNAAKACVPSELSPNGEVEIVIKKFDPDVARATIDGFLIKDEPLQQSLANDTLLRLKNIAEANSKANLFASLYESLGGRFASSNKQNDEDENVEVLLNLLGEVNKPLIEKKLKQLADESSDHKILGVNILEKIKNDCPTDLQLEQFIKSNITDRAKSFLQFAVAEIGKNNGIGKPNEGYQLVIPDEGGEFRKRFIEKFRSQFSDRNAVSVSSSMTNKQNEIVVIAMKSGFPLRVIQNLKYLEEQYKALVSPHNKDAALNKVLLHTESLTSRELPSLFDSDPAERRQQFILQAIKLHSIPNLLHKGVDPESGEEVNIVTIGKGFNAQDVIVGKDAIATTRLLSTDSELRKGLSGFLDDVISEKYPTSKARKEFMGNIENMVCTEVLNACGNNRLSPEFKEYVKVAQDYFNTLN